MSGSQLTDEELRQAAAEAGISPQELRHALVERDGGTAVARAEHGMASVLGPPARGLSARHAESRIEMAPADALAAVRNSIERQTNSSGHSQGGTEADVVDDRTRLTYRVRSEDDGSGGALVRIDVDPSAGKGLAALSGGAMGAISLTLLALGWLFGATMLIGGGFGMGVLAGLSVFRALTRLNAATNQAQAVASHALMEAEDAAGRSAKALQPGPS